MLALSVRPPCGQLIIMGLKTLECRSWRPPKNKLKPGDRLLIHSSKTVHSEFFQLYHDRIAPDYAEAYVKLDRGKYIGMVEYQGVIGLTEKNWGRYLPQHLCDWEFQEFQWGWKLQVIKNYVNPIPGKGQLGLFKPSKKEIK